MLSGARLGQEFWAEMVETTCYLVNRSPSSALEDTTPQEGYKLWNPVTRKVLYIQDVVFREVKDAIKIEVQPKKLKKIEFELKEEESNSTAEKESEDEEPQTPGVRRSVQERRKPERDLEEEIYMKQPKFFAVKGKKELCPKENEEEEDMSCVPYVSAVSSLMYAMVYIRPDIAHAVGVLSRFTSKPGKEHWIVVKRVFRYLRGTSDYGLCYQGRPGLDRVLDIRGFVDADWAGDFDQRRSTSGYVFNLFGGAVSWMSKKQSVVALSTTEAEYMATTHASKETVWLQRLCSSMGLVQGAIRIDCDSQCAIFLAKNPAYHSKKEHIDVQYHFVRDMIEDKKVLLVKVDTLKNTADALTKSVSSEKFSWCRETMGVSGLKND
eukprot:PITA_28820